MKTITKGLLAATALVSLPALANAAPVITNVSILVPATTSGVYINVVTGVVGTTPSAAPGWDINPWGSGSLFFYSATTGGIVMNGTSVADLAAGAVIGAGSTYATSPAAATAFSATGGEHVFGFKFLNETTGITNYGYARITTTAGANGRPATITQLVYDNAGASIIVAGATGAVPEPATWAMMLMGFGAIGAGLRRRATVNTRVRFA